MKKRILFLVNHHVVIFNFRRELVESLLAYGYEVYISSPYGKRIDDLTRLGCKYIETKIDRRGTSIFSDVRLVIQYMKLLRTVRPDVMLTYTVKPNIYGNLAGNVLGIPSLANITGLGTAMDDPGLTRWLLIQLYKIAFRDVRCVFFQNEANRQFFLDHKIRMRKHRMIPGSGVNLEQHAFEEYPEEKEDMRFLFVGRVMKEKGIEELVAAAKIVKSVYPNVQFDAVGFCEDDYLERARALESLQLVNFHGQQDDVHEYIKRSHAVVLPSHHEGMANVLLEAAATGRPVVASNIPGCRETFDEGVSGLGFRMRDAQDLAATLLKFIDLSYDDKKEMGRMGRQKVEKEYDREVVVAAYLEEVETILNAIP